MTLTDERDVSLLVSQTGNDKNRIIICTDELGNEIIIFDDVQPAATITNATPLSVHLDAGTYYFRIYEQDKVTQSRINLYGIEIK